jgi:hypothetical protein
MSRTNEDDPRRDAETTTSRELLVLSVLAALASLAVGMMIVSAVRLAWVLS